MLTTASNPKGRNFCLHDRRSPIARRTDALYRASTAAARPPRGPS
jgi:hypothetical protein